jgi:uncharacterized protein (TIGR00725 family)
MEAPLYIAVVGSSLGSNETSRLAEEVGRAIAEAGARLVCGGLGGVMEAACRGAKSIGGMTVGILPTLNRYDANPYVDVAIPTGMGEMRNALVVRCADAVVAVQGEFGTLSEIGFALRTGVPVVGLETWDLHRGSEAVDAFPRAKTAEEAVALALAATRA